jgi:hypothetical protein
LYPECKGLALLNSTASADSEERKLNRDRYSRRETIFINFISLSIANLFEGNRERLVNEIENVKNKALKTPLQGIVASLEGMKIRNDREVIHLPLFKITSSWRRTRFTTTKQNYR